MNIIHTNKKFASEFMSEIPLGIVDKQVCGCGLTTIALENDAPTIIAVPNVQLIKNKQSQYPNSRSKHTIYGLYGSKHRSDLLEKYIAYADVPKIMVTYDSLHKCEHLLTQGWKLIIDEADQLLHLNDLKVSGSHFGNDAINKVYEIIARHKDKVSLISATQIPLKYLPPFLSELQTTRIDWCNVVNSQPILMQRGKPYSAVSSDIISPMERNGEAIIEGVIIKKVVLFVNSLSAIMTIISDNLLAKEDVAIVCSNSVVSLSKLNGYKLLEDYTKLPKYTFITSSGFQGIDLYDKEAIAVVVSCTSKQYTMFGVEHQVKQAVSRIRNTDNEHLGRYIFLYNQSIFESSEAELCAELDRLEVKYEELAKHLDSSGSTRNQEFLSGLKHEYKKYLTITDGHVAVNKNSLNADRFFVMEVRKAYEKGFDASTLFEGSDFTEHKRIVAAKKTSKVNYEAAARTLSKMKLDPSNLENPTSLMPRVVSWYGLTLSLSNYNKFVLQLETNGKIELNAGKAVAAIQISSTDRVKQDILNTFRVFNKYSRQEVKFELGRIYNAHGISKAAVYTDLLNFLQYEETRTAQSRFIKIISHTTTK